MHFSSRIVCKTASWFLTRFFFSQYTFVVVENEDKLKKNIRLSSGELRDGLGPQLSTISFSVLVTVTIVPTMERGEDWMSSSETPVESPALADQ